MQFVLRATQTGIAAELILARAHMGLFRRPSRMKNRRLTHAAVALILGVSSATIARAQSDSSTQDVKALRKQLDDQRR